MTEKHPVRHDRAATEPRWVVVVLGAGRAAPLQLLIEDLAREAGSTPLHAVHLFDDAAPGGLGAAHTLIRQQRWRLWTARHHHGKRGRWRWVSRAFQTLRSAPADALFVFLAEDCRLAPGFFDSALAQWHAIDDPRKLALTLHVDAHRAHSPCWTGVAPERIGNLWRTQWVDDAFLAPVGLLQALSYRVPPVSPRRWTADPNLSSGVGRAISIQLNGASYGLYRVHENLVERPPRDAATDAGPAPAPAPRPEAKRSAAPKATTGRAVSRQLQRPRPASIPLHAAVAQSWQPAPAHPRWVVVIMTYRRAPLLCDLLLDLERERHAWPDLQVRVYDDASPTDYAPVQAMLRRNGWLFRRADTTHGKRGYAAWVTQTYQDLETVGDDTMLAFLPDDVRLCRDFLTRAWDLWCSIDDRRKVSLNVLLDGLRQDGPRWTGFPPRAVGRVEQTQWVDGAFVADLRFLRAVGHRVPPIDPARWRRNPDLSSGVGQALSRLLHRNGWHLYRVRRSLVVHVRAPSQMNPDIRKREPMNAVNFVDGLGNAIRLERRIPVLVSLASIPSRAAQLEQVVASLLPQVTRLRVYLNGYPHVPTVLRHERIDIARSQDHGDRGDAGKFWWCGRDPDAYLFTCDDDIVYPPDYVAHLVNAVEQYARRALVGLHGVTLKPRLHSYYRDRRVIHCRRGLDRDCAVHLLGTGALAWHSTTLSITPEDFPAPNMADIWVGVLCQQRRIPTVSVARPAEWLRVLPCDDTIFDQARNRDHTQTRAVNALGHWRLLPLPATGADRRRVE